MEKKTEKQIYNWLKSQITVEKKWHKLTVIVALLQNLFSICQAWLISWILSLVLSASFALKNLTVPVFWLLSIFILKALTQWGKAICGFKAGVTIRQHIRSKVLHAANKKNQRELDSINSGEWVLLLQERIERLHNFYALYIPQQKIILIYPLLVISIVFYYNWAVGLIFMITAPLVPMFMFFVGTKAAEANRKNFQQLSILGHNFLDRVRGLWTLRLFYRAYTEKNNIKKSAEKFRIQTMKVLRLAFLSSAVLEFFSSVSIALTAVYLGMSYLGYINFGSWGSNISIFTGFFLLLLAPEFYQSLKDLGSYYHSKAEAIAAAESIIKFTSEKNNAIQEGIEKFDIKEINIKCKNVTVKGSNNKNILTNISFEINDGEHIGLVGQSGSGKSTLIKTLLGFYPYEGSILINDKELRSIKKSHYHKNISWLGQKPKLVYGSIAENVSLGLQNLNQEQIMQALDDALATEFVAQTTKGINTIIGDSNSGLSIGQAQRISLARTIVRQGAFLLLDEPTSSLDKQNEKLVIKAIKKYSNKKTMLMATHRTPHLKNCDSIIFLENGKIIEKKSFSVLKEKIKHLGNL